jgi:hypothetical protein
MNPTSSVLPPPYTPGTSTQKPKFFGVPRVIAGSCQSSHSTAGPLSRLTSPQSGSRKREGAVAMPPFPLPPSRSFNFVMGLPRFSYFSNAPVEWAATLGRPRPRAVRFSDESRTGWFRTECCKVGRICFSGASSVLRSPGRGRCRGSDRSCLFSACVSSDSSLSSRNSEQSVLQLHLDGHCPCDGVVNR